MKTNIELNGVKISISARFVEFDKPAWDNKEWHPHFKIRVRVNNPVYIQRTHTYDFWGSIMDYRNNKQELNERELLECLSCLFSDASAFDCNRDFVEFCREFGYERIDDYHYAMRTYKACEQAHKACVRLFGKYYGSVHNDLEEYLDKLNN